MKIAIFETPTEAERYREFRDNITLSGNADGSIYIETYASTRGGSCRYGQHYKAGDTTDAIKRFVDFYWPLNQRDNEAE